MSYNPATSTTPSSGSATLHPAQHSGAQQRLQLAAPRPPSPPLPARVAGSVLLAIVLGLVSLITTVGVAVLLPGAFGGPWSLLVLHYPLALALAGHILLNYALCVLRHPGEVEAGGRQWGSEHVGVRVAAVAQVLLIEAGRGAVCCMRLVLGAPIHVVLQTCLSCAFEDLECRIRWLPISIRCALLH